jgi:hypothetical protein
MESRTDFGGPGLASLARKKEIDSVLADLYRNYMRVIRENCVRPCHFRHGVQLHVTALTIFSEHQKIVRIQLVIL